LNDVRKRVAMEKKSLELEQYSVSKPRNDNIVKHYGNSDHGKNKAFRKSFRKNTGFQNVPHVYETTDKFNELKRRIQSIRKINLYNKRLKDAVHARKEGPQQNPPMNKVLGAACTKRGSNSVFTNISVSVFITYSAEAHAFTAHFKPDKVLYVKFPYESIKSNWTISLNSSLSFLS
jgi:hypothetical protein